MRTAFKFTQLLSVLAVFLISPTIASAEDLFSFGTGDQTVTLNGFTVVDTGDTNNVRGQFTITGATDSFNNAISLEGLTPQGYFNNFSRNSEQSINGGTVATSIGGEVYIYNTLSLFEVTDDFGFDISRIAADNDLLLKGSGREANIFFNASTYTSTGLLDWDFGRFLTAFDTNDKLAGADATFNIGCSFNLNGLCSGSADINTTVSQVPLPASSFLFGSVMLAGFTGLKVRKKS